MKPALEDRLLRNPELIFPNSPLPIFAFDCNSRRMPYDVEPTIDLAVLVGEIDADPTGIFWG